MADFGPRVFHALAHLADCDKNNTFKTQSDVEAFGFPKEERGKNVVETVETLKNAIFKTLMLRVRNKLYFYSLINKVPDDCVVTLKLKVSKQFLNGNSDTKHAINSARVNMEIEEISALLPDELSALASQIGGDHRILPSPLLDKILDSCGKTVEKSANLAGVCANNAAVLNNAFEGDEDFDKLPPIIEHT